MSKHLVTMFCGFQALGHTPAQKYCNRKCAGFHVTRSQKPKPLKKRLNNDTRPHLSSQSPLWDSAKCYQNSNGYLVLYVRDPVTGHKYFRSAHIVVWERAHHMRVPPGCILHHLNGIPWDIRSENIVCIPVSIHMALHAQLRELAREQLSTVAYNVRRHAIHAKFMAKAKEELELQNL